MTYISLYRKYRSQDFDEIVGQEPIIQTLKNAISSSRLGHAYLFTGPRGTGKTSTARIFAKALNCSDKKGDNPCGKCDQCVKITSGHALNVIEIDAASNRGIDEIRDLREKIKYKPVEGRYKIYIIDEVHMLTSEAFNALLKTLEEPPADTLFILATTEPQKVPVTISSRCQRFDFGRISFDKISAHLKAIAKEEGFKIEDDALQLIARSSEGSLRDAISLMDQLVSFCEGTIKAEDVTQVLGTAEPEFLFEMGRAILGRNDKEVLSLVERSVSQGVSVPQLARDLVYHFRNLMLVKIKADEMLDLSKEQIKRLAAEAEKYPLKELKDTVVALSGAETDMKWHHNPRIVLEVALLEILEEGKGTGDRAQGTGDRAQGTGDREQGTGDRVQGAVGILPPQSLSGPLPLGKGETAGRREGVTASSDKLSKVLSSWKDVLSKVRGKTLFGFVSLSEATPKGTDTNGRIVLSFRKGYSFHKSRVEENANKTCIEQVLSDTLGEKTFITCVLEAEESHPRPQEKRTSADDIAELFDGQIIT